MCLDATFGRPLVISDNPLRAYHAVCHVLHATMHLGDATVPGLHRSPTIPAGVPQGKQSVSQCHRGAVEVVVEWLQDRCLVLHDSTTLTGGALFERIDKVHRDLVKPLCHREPLFANASWKTRSVHTHRTNLGTQTYC